MVEQSVVYSILPKGWELNAGWEAPHKLGLRVCLFRGEIRWIENFGEKIKSKTFLSVFGWVKRKENK